MSVAWLVEIERGMTFLNCRYRLQEAQTCRGKRYTGEAFMSAQENNAVVLCGAQENSIPG